MKTALYVVITTALATSVAFSQPSRSLRNGLDAAVRASEPGELLPVVIVMSEQTPRASIDAAALIDDKAARRQSVLELLRETASRTQGGVLAALAQGRRAGLVGERVRPLYIANVIAADVSAELVTELSQRNDIAYIHHDKQLGDEVFPVEPSEGRGGVTAAITCGLNRINAPDVWNMGLDGSGVVVGVLDGGLCLTHPDIQGNVWINADEIPGNNIDDDNNGYVDDLHGWNFYRNTNDVHDSGGHGTHVSGTVAGNGANGEQTGVAPGAEIMVLYVLGRGFESDAWEGIQYGITNGADVFSGSLGWAHLIGPDRAMWRMVSENIFASGVVAVFAAGNTGDFYGVDSVATPGDVPDMITVGGTDCADDITDFSSRGPVTWEDVDPYFDWPLPEGKRKPTVSAPAEDVLSLWIDSCSGYARLSGTSMATPHVSGTVALMLHANPELDHNDAKRILEETAVDLGAAGPDNQSGHGRIDALAAVEMALDMGGCPADLDGDGDVDADDFFDYLDAFAADNLAVCDLDGDADCDADDFFGYLDQFAAGC